MREPITVLLTTECPCGAEVHLVEDADGLPGVSHREPRCETFDRLDAYEYAKWLRLNAQGALDS